MRDENGDRFVPLGYTAPPAGPGRPSDDDIATMFRRLAEHGWIPESESADRPTIAMRRDRCAVTLEPGCQVELSGTPLTNVHAVLDEFRVHMKELRTAAPKTSWLGLGFHPFARRDDLEWVPKLRYAIMRDYLPTRGAFALDMMLRTATVQANFDFESEHDALKKMRVGLALSPIVTAMFANSPFVEGRITGERSHRARIWLDVDNDRSGILPFMWADNASFASYAQWALDVPMFVVKRGDQVYRNTTQSFRDFLRQGAFGTHAMMSDWQTHLNTLFPDVRLKHTIEVRSADSQGNDMLAALPAFWTGLFYDSKTLDRAEELASNLPLDHLVTARSRIPEEGLGVSIGNRTALDWACDALELSEAGLAARKEVDGSGKDERIHLAQLRTNLERGESPADALLRDVKKADNLLDFVTTRCAL